LWLRFGAAGRHPFQFNARFRIPSGPARTGERKDFEEKFCGPRNFPVGSVFLRSPYLSHRAPWLRRWLAKPQFCFCFCLFLSLAGYRHGTKRSLPATSDIDMMKLYSPEFLGSTGRYWFGHRASLERGAS